MLNKVLSLKLGDFNTFLFVNSKDLVPVDASSPLVKGTAVTIHKKHIPGFVPLVEVAHSYILGHYAPLQMSAALELYYWSPLPARECIDDFLESPYGLKLKQECIEAVKDKRWGAFNIKFNEKACVDGIKRMLVIYTEVLENFFKEEFPKDCLNGKKATENDINALLLRPEMNTRVGEFLIHSRSLGIWQALTNYVKKEFPQDHIIALYSNKHLPVVYDADYKTYLPVIYEQPSSIETPA